MIKLILVDDHKIFREGLRKLLVSEQIANVIADVGDGKQFLDILDQYDPDLVLMDISMPVLNGIEAAKKAIERKPELRILALSSFGDEKYYYKMIETGVKGFVLKDSGFTELQQAINEISSGGSWFSNELLRKVIVNLNKASNKKADFSDREQEVLTLICNGLTNDQMAEKLNLSPDTIKWHRNNLLSKTGCSNTAALVLFAIKEKIIEI
jgi:DNA-binding NarL/FixJ family response regulator